MATAGVAPLATTATGAHDAQALPSDTHTHTSATLPASSAAKQHPASPTVLGRAAEWFAAYMQAGHVDIRTPEVLEREKYLFWHPRTGKFNRWYLWIPVMVTQICIGSLYSWSIFNKSMDQKVWSPRGYSTGTNANAFTICVASFGFATALFGPAVERYGPFWSCRWTVILTPAGWAAAALGSWLPNLGVLYALFGVLHGVGAAMAYISTCSAIQKWFPEFKGFATGMAVMGFGLGSFIWTNVGRTLMDPTGYNMAPYQVQGIFAVIYLGALALSLPFMRLPPPGYVPETAYIATEQSCRGRVARALVQKSKLTPSVTESMTLKSAILSLEFGLLCLMAFGQFITGVVFLSSAADMTQYIFGNDSNYGAFIASMMNLVNFTGRVGWGSLSDRTGRKSFYLFSTATQAFAVGLMALWIEKGHFGLWLLSFLLIGSLYGGGFGVLPAFVSDLFGPKISAATHGIMISMWSLSSIVGIPIFTSFTGSMQRVVNGTKVPAPEAYIRNCYWLCALPAISFLALLFLNVNPRDREAQHKTKTVRIRCFTHVLAVRCLGPKAQDAEAHEIPDKSKAPAVLAPPTAGAAHEADVDVESVAASIGGSTDHDDTNHDGSSGVKVIVADGQQADQSSTGSGTSSKAGSSRASSTPRRHSFAAAAEAQQSRA